MQRTSKIISFEPRIYECAAQVGTKDAERYGRTNDFRLGPPRSLSSSRDGRKTASNFRVILSLVCSNRDRRPERVPERSRKGLNKILID